MTFSTIKLKSKDCSSTQDNLQMAINITFLYNSSPTLPGRDMNVVFSITQSGKSVGVEFPGLDISKNITSPSYMRSLWNHIINSGMSKRGKVHSLFLEGNFRWRETNSILFEDPPSKLPCNFFLKTVHL